MSEIEHMIKAFQATNNVKNTGEAHEQKKALSSEWIEYQDEKCWCYGCDSRYVNWFLIQEPGTESSRSHTILHKKFVYCDEIKLWKDKNDE